MTELVPGLEQYCIDAANRHPGTLPRRRRLRRGHTPFLGIVAALTISSAAAYAVEAIWHPVLGDGRRAPATASYSAVPTSQAAALSILRRPQRDSDRSPASEKALSYQDVSRRGIRTDSIRVLGRTTAGEAVVLVPVAELRPGGPASLRRGSIKDALCIWVEDLAEAGGDTCTGVEGLLRGDLVSRAMGPEGVTIVGVVPDGIARVSFGQPGASDHRTVDVVDNWYTTTLTAMPAGPPTMIDGEGRVVEVPLAKESG